MVIFLQYNYNRNGRICSLLKSAPRCENVSFCKLIEKWLTVPYSEGTAHLWLGIAPNGKPYTSQKPLIFDTGIYEFLRRTEVNPSHCAPQIILEDIQAYYVAN